MTSLSLLLLREEQVRKAVAAYPGIPLDEAFEKWAKEHHVKHTVLKSSGAAAREARIKKHTQKRCPAKGCKGTVHLEAICSSCLDAKKGYNSKWTCDTCDYLSRSQKDFSEWFIDE
jgi:hypothetical protein